jgi:predicted nucleic acid-binding Zn ribbon protein
MQLLAGAPITAGKVGFAWGIAVGPAVARVSAVRLDGDVLIVEATSEQWVTEIKRSRTVILSRMQTLVGQPIGRLEVRTNPNLKPVKSEV